MTRMDAVEAKAFKAECDKWKGYKKIEDYIEDVVMCLVYSSWKYTEDQARECVKDRKKYVESAFKNKEPANDCCAEIGFYGG